MTIKTNPLVLVKVCKIYFLIGIICNYAIGGEKITFASINIGQVFHWATIFAASVIVLHSFRNQRAALLLIASILVFRGLEFALPVFNTYYFIMVGILFLFTGVIMFTQDMDLIYKQVMIIAILNVIIMIMQLTGVTKLVFMFTSFNETPQILAQTLFVKAPDLFINKVQIRPSGFMSSPVYQSLFTFVALVLHLARKRRRFPGGSVIIALLIVISMSKVPILGLAGISTIYFIKGDSSKKLFVAKVILIYLFVLGLYAFFFPGIFHYTMTPTYWAFSFFTRLNNIIDIVYGGSEFAPLFLQVFTADTVRAYWHPQDVLLSGYAVIAFYRSILIKVVPAFIIAIWLWFKKYRKLNSWFPEYAALSLACMYTICVFPGLFNIFRNPLYWFIAGGAVLPIILNSQKRIFINTTVNEI